jgi:3-hydroxyacyl-CoA dehydrogenase
MAKVTPEVADRIVDVDDAIVGGFGWELGPFHTLDALFHAGIEGDGPFVAMAVPEALAKAERYYRNEGGKHFYYDFKSARMEALPLPPDMIVLKDARKAGKAVEEAVSASLVDLGDGLVCLEWRTKMNVLDSELVEFIGRSLERAAKDFSALVIGGSGENFSAGFNLGFFVEKIENSDWTAIDSAINDLQQMVLRLKYSRIPVVAATYGYTLGAGCETMLYCTAVQAAFESYIGLPEANVGLIPAGGGTAAMILRAYQEVPPGTSLERPDPFPFLRPLWDNLRLAKISTSAEEARNLGYITEDDGVTVHPDRLLYDAKERGLAAAASYRPPEPQTIMAMGEDGLARFRWEIHLLRRGQQIMEHDARIADRLAYMLCGGGLVHPAEVSEQYLLDLERETFLSLCGNPETLARIKHTLVTGKPLRN